MSVGISGSFVFEIVGQISSKFSIVATVQRPLLDSGPLTTEECAVRETTIEWLQRNNVFCAVRA
jgi:hypothetical protein